MREHVREILRGKYALFLRKNLSITKRKTMIDKEQILQIAESLLPEGSELFVVDVKISRAQDIELTVDSDTRVYIDECAKLSKAIEAELDGRGEEDYSLTVSSAGIGSPFKIQRQFDKCIGKPVEIVLKQGRKLSGELLEATSEKITISYSQKEAVEGKKKKELVVKQESYDMNEIKSVHELLTIK